MAQGEKNQKNKNDFFFQPPKYHAAQDEAKNERINDIIPGKMDVYRDRVSKPRRKRQTNSEIIDSGM